MPVNNDESLVKVGERARKWLCANAVVVTGAESLADMVNVLIGLYLCDILDGSKGHPESLRVARLLSNYLQQKRKEPSSENSSTTLLLIASRILSLYNLPCGVLDRFVSSTAKKISTLGVSVPDDCRGIQLILNRMGLVKMAPEAGVIEKTGINGGMLGVLLADENRLDGIIDRIYAASLWGISTIRGNKKALHELERALVPVTIQRLRIYDIERGSRLLRSLAYLDVKGKKRLESAMRFLKMQQRDDGAFGYFSYELMNAGILEDAVALRRFYISITVNSLWTVAEVEVPHFRLFLIPL